MSLGHLVPAPVRAFVRQWQRDNLFRKSLSDIRRNGANEQNLQALCSGWGNEGWSADTGYLMKVLELAAAAPGNILECGSGVTTFLLGLKAQKKVISLEHIPQWADRLNRTLAVNGLANRVTPTTLIGYGDFDWYRLPEGFPGNISLVICDGPPSTTKGGRSGLLPVISSYLAPNAIVLMDDAEREDERAIIKEWSAKYPISAEMCNTATGELAVLRVGQTVSPSTK